MTKIKKIFFLSAILVFFGFSCPKKKQNELENSNPYVSATSSFDDKSNLLTIKIDISKGYYAYAPGEKIGKPVSLEISKKNGWSMASHAEIPAGTPKKVFGEEISLLLEGNFEIKQKLKPGFGAGEGFIFLQICAKDICHKPGMHKINW